MNQVNGSLQLATGDIHYMKAGSGPPLVVLHHSFGSHGWLPLYDLLAARHEVYIPDLPGFGESTRPVWARDVRDIAAIMEMALDRLGLEDVTLAGMGFGGWVAAEMAVMNQGRLDHLVLAGAAGIQPREGFIADQLVIDYVDYVQMGFADRGSFNENFGEDPSVPTRMTLYAGREMTMRVTWKPWMFRRQLPHLLQGVQTPALVLWGSEDQIVPIDSGKQYADALPNSKLVVIEGAGHNLDFERPNDVADAILASSRTLAAVS